MVAIRDLCAYSNGSLTVLAALQQPNARILSLFADLLVLDRGGTTAYFGPMMNAEMYFLSVGYKMPSNTTMTDYFLHIAQENKEGGRNSNNNNSNNNKVQTRPSLSTQYEASSLRASIAKLQALSCIVSNEASSLNSPSHSPSSPSSSSASSTPSRSRQFIELTRRNWQVATRDVTLYYLQLILNSGFGFMVI